MQVFASKDAEIEDLRKQLADTEKQLAATEKKRWQRGEQAHAPCHDLIASLQRRNLAALELTRDYAKAGTETPVAFFQCASNITAFDVAGANVAVGCAGGQVLQMRAAVLLTEKVHGRARAPPRQTTRRR